MLCFVRTGYLGTILSADRNGHRRWVGYRTDRDQRYRWSYTMVNSTNYIAKKEILPALQRQTQPCMTGQATRLQQKQVHIIRQSAGQGHPRTRLTHHLYSKSKQQSYNRLMKLLKTCCRKRRKDTPRSRSGSLPAAVCPSCGTYPCMT